MSQYLITQQQRLAYAAAFMAVSIAALIALVAFVAMQSRYIERRDAAESLEAKLAQAELAVKQLHAQAAEQRVQGMITGMELVCGQ